MLSLLSKPISSILEFISAIRAFLRRFILSILGVSIGKATYISPKAYIDCHRGGKVTIGENCYITRGVVILSHTDTKRGGPLGIWEKEGGKREFGNVHIGNNVFIGVNSVILPGISIGDNALIGALTLVDKDVPAGKIAAGVPAQIKGDTKDHLTSRKPPMRSRPSHPKRR